MIGIQFELSVPYECSFIKQTAVNSLDSYSIPPLTTVRGMIYNAMARPSLLFQDYHTTRTVDKDLINEEYEFRKRFESSTHMGIEVVDEGIMKSDLRTRMKHGGRSGELGNTGGDNISLSYVAKHQTIVNPRYLVTMMSESERYIEATREALNNPRRILYLGTSDNLVDVKDISTSGFEEVNESLSSDRIVMPNSSGDSMEMLPIKMESFEGRGTADRGESQVVSYGNAESDSHYEPTDTESKRVVPID